MQSKSEMKIILCSIPVKTERYSQRELSLEIPKIAIVSLMKWIEKYGYNPDFFDIDLLNSSDIEILEYFKGKQPDVVGLSAVVSTSYLKVKKISRIIKEANPKTIIAIGGNMAVSANLLLRKTEIDFCVLGDGEKPLLELLKYINENGKKKIMNELLKIKGLAFLNKENEMEFTGYGIPILSEESVCTDYEVLKKGLLSKPELISSYFGKAREETTWFANDPRTFEPDRKQNAAMVLMGKGCVAKCTFCQRFSRGFHTFGMKKLERYISDLKNKYDVQSIIIGGENFGLPREYAYQVAKLLKKYDMLWVSYASRCTNFKAEDYEFFRNHNCIGIQFGVESGSPKILSIMEKRFTVQQIYDALKLTIKYSLESPMAFWSDIFRSWLW